MPLRLALLVISFVHFLSVPFPKQSPSPIAVERDPQAIAVANQVLSAAGGSAQLAAIQDFTASGTITYYWDPDVTGNATVLGRGLRQFRIDATLQNGVRKIIANNGSGSITEADGTVTLMPYEAASDLGSMTFPYSILLAALQDPTITITDLGLVEHNGKQLHQIRVLRTYSKFVATTGLQGELTERDFFIDPSSLLVASVLNAAGQGADGNGILREVVFANYQVVSGVTIPLQITEKVGDQSLCTLQFAQIAFNTGLSDENFNR